MKTVLVTGGTGFIGSNLARALSKAGCHVRILRREHSDLRAIGSTDVEHCIGDVRDPTSIKRAMKGCDTVFHTAAIISYWKKERALLMDVNVNGTRNIVDTCLEQGIEKLVHTSSIAAIGFRNDGALVDESTPFNWEPYDVEYRNAKHLAEKEIQRGVKLGLPAVIVNPAVVIGPRDIHFHGGQIIRDVYKKRIFYYTGGGTNVVYVDDVVRGHLIAAKQGRFGERYILGGQNLTYREIFSITAEMVGGIMPVFQLPRPAVKAVGLAVEGISNVFGMRPWVTRELLAGVGLYAWFSLEKAQRELAYTFTSFRDAVQRSFEWYRENGLL